MRRNLETDAVRNGKSRNRPPVLPATYNTGKTDSYRGTTGTASAPGTRINVSYRYCRKSVAGDGRFPLGSFIRTLLASVHGKNPKLCDLRGLEPHCWS